MERVRDECWGGGKRETVCEAGGGMAIFWDLYGYSGERSSHTVNDEATPSCLTYGWLTAWRGPLGEKLAGRRAV